MRFKTAIRLVAVWCMLSFLGACTKDSGMDPSLSIFQEYQVVVVNGSASAFANFRIGSATGDRVKLTGGSSISVNTHQMFYQEPESPVKPEFNYSYSLNPMHNLAKFRFVRSGSLTLNNEVDFSAVPSLDLPASAISLSNGTRIPIDFQDLPASEIRVCLVSEKETTLENAIFALVNTNEGYAVFSGVPAGYYELVADVVRVTPTVQNDGDARGTITVVKRTVLHSVKVQ